MGALNDDRRGKPGFELLCGCIEGGKVRYTLPRPILAWRITE